MFIIEYIVDLIPVASGILQRSHKYKVLAQGYIKRKLQQNLQISFEFHMLKFPLKFLFCSALLLNRKLGNFNVHSDIIYQKMQRKNKFELGNFGPFSIAILVHNTLSILFIYYFNLVLLELFILVYVSYTVHYVNSVN